MFCFESDGTGKHVSESDITNKRTKNMFSSSFPDRSWQLERKRKEGENQHSNLLE